MRRLPAWLLLSAFVLAAGAPRPVEAREVGTAGDARLRARIERHLRKAKLQAGRYGLAVLTRGARPRAVYVHDSSRALVPASSAKVLTSAAALDLLGPSHRFVTRITARGEATKEGTFSGDLVAHGVGDPNLSGRFHDGDPMKVLDALARAVRRAGIERVTGCLVLDDGAFDRAYVHPDWSAEDRKRWYGAPVAGLAFNDSCIDVTVRASKGGRHAGLELAATSGPWRVDNRVLTRAGGRSGAGGQWVDDGRVLRLTGRLAPGRSASFHVPVREPVLFFGGALLKALARRGVKVAGGQRLARDREDRRPGRVVAEHASALLPTLAVVNQDSQNFYASSLFKACGVAHEGVGSWAAGERAVRVMLERRRIAEGPGLSLRDGSGLSPKNRISAGVLAQVLSSFDGDILRGPALLDSLAVSGLKGTLRKRLRDRGVRGRVHAKTGTLNDTRARALAGYVDGRDGHPGYVFAILLNGRGASHGVIDDVVRELCR